MGIELISKCQRATSQFQNLVLAWSLSCMFRGPLFLAMAYIPYQLLNHSTSISGQTLMLRTEDRPSSLIGVFRSLFPRLIIVWDELHIAVIEFFIEWIL